jgi:hypothetical protein
MSRIKNHTSNALKEYLIENFSGKRFCVLDLHDFATMRGISVKTLTYSCWWLCKTGTIVKCGKRSKKEGGSPINIYKLSDRKPDNFPCVDMQSAAFNLERAMSK